MTHILLIDDRRDDRLLAARELERAIEGLHITEIASAQEFARALAAADFDMVVTDHQLPWSDGTAVVRAVKARCPDCPVIMFSATATAEEAVAAMREGLDDYVSKSPRHFSRLALAAQAALERLRARRRIAALEAEQAEALAREQSARVAAERLADRIGRLQTVTASLAAAPRPVDVARAVTEQCVAALGARASAVMLLSAADRSLQLLYQAGYGAAFQGWEQFSIDAPYPFAEVVRGCEPIYLASRAEFNARYPELAAGRAVSEAAAYLPLIVEEQAIGGMSIGFAAPRLLDAEERAFLEALAAQCAQALDRARLYAAEQRARERLAFLAEASTLLVASLDYDATLQQIARLCVPRLADWCVVDTPGEDGTLEMQIVTHTDPEKERWAREIRERFTIDIDHPVGASQVIRTGEPLLVAQVTDELLQLAAREEEELRLLRLVGYRSMIVVPLRANERIIGTLALMTTDESGRRYTGDDVALAEELARRAGVALDNARLYAEAQGAIQARDQFLAVAAHELKTPLTTLIGRSQLIGRRLEQRPDADPRLKQSIQVIAGQGQRLNRLVANLLDVSRIQDRRLELNLAPLDLRPLAERVVSDFQVDVERQRIELLLPDAPLTVNGDALRLEQVLANLLQNAIKYSPPEATITIELRQAGAMAVISVQDRGIGIPETAIPHLFTRFYRAPNVDYQHISGMGIGLFLVRQIVTQHGGRVEVASAEGEGTCFTVSLPLPLDN